MGGSPGAGTSIPAYDIVGHSDWTNWASIAGGWLAGRNFSCSSCGKYIPLHHRRLGGYGEALLLVQDPNVRVAGRRSKECGGFPRSPLFVGAVRFI